MNVVGVRHEPRRNGENCERAGLDFFVRLDIPPRVGWIAVQRDEIVNAAVTLLEEAVEVMKRASEKFSDNFPGGTLARAAGADEVNHSVR